MRIPTAFAPIRLAAFTICIALVAPACVHLPPPGVDVVWIRVGPPRPRHDVRPPRPGVEFIWIDGFYRWERDDYRWVPGHWERRPHPHARWYPGHWYHEHRGWYWVPGHWK